LRPPFWAAGESARRSKSDERSARGVPLFAAQTVAGHRDDLDRKRGTAFSREKSSRNGAGCFSAVIFDDAEDFTAKENSAVDRHGVPTLRVEIIDPVGEHKTKTGRAVPVAMPFAQIAQRRRQPAQGIRGVIFVSHVRPVRGQAQNDFVLSVVNFNAPLVARPAPTSGTTRALSRIAMLSNCLNRVGHFPVVPDVGAGRATRGALKFTTEKHEVVLGFGPEQAGHG